MRTALTIITIIWIALGLMCFPFIYLIAAFSTDNASDLQRLIVSCVLLFYVQLVVQSIVALICLKRINFLRGYLIAILLILVPSLVSLPSGLLIGTHLASNSILMVTLYGTLILQLFGSVWMWVVIGMRMKQPSTTLPTPSVAQPPSAISQQMSDTPQGPITTAIPLPTIPLTIPLKSHKKLGIVILLTPFVFFILGMIFMAITFQVNPEYYTLSLTKSFPFGKIGDFMAGSSGVLFAPCVTVGIVLLARK